MVKAAEKRSRCDGAKTLGDAMERGVLGQGSMSSLLGVVARVGGQDPAQVHVAEDHDVVQAFSSDRADEAFDVSVLPGRSWCRWSVPDAHGREASCYGVTIGGVSVADEVLGRLIPGEGFGDLSGDPVRSGVGSDVDPDQVALLEPDDYQPIEQLEANSGHDEQVNRTNMRGVIAKESLPAMRWRSAPSDHILGHGRLGDLEAQLEQLAVDARRTS
jgi:hypothetical protein